MNGSSSSTNARQQPAPRRQTAGARGNGPPRPQVTDQQVEQLAERLGCRAVYVAADGSGAVLGAWQFVRLDGRPLDHAQKAALLAGLRELTGT